MDEDNFFRVVIAIGDICILIFGLCFLLLFFDNLFWG